MKTKSHPHSAFFSPRALIGAFFCFAGFALAFFAFQRAEAQGRSEAPPVVKGIYRGVLPVVKYDVSPPLRDILITPSPGQLRRNEDRTIVPWKIRFAPQLDQVLQSSVGDREIPSPIVSFDAQPNLSGVNPPDPNGDVGPNHIVTMSNLQFQIFNKTGTPLTAPAANNSLWAGFGGACQNENSGDPVVLYDHLADRWFLSQFTSAGPYFFCVAISTTPDPTGTYHRYAIATGNNFPDYPKVGVWPDAYYISTREFPDAGGFAGVGAYALNRAQAVAGNPAAQVIAFLAPPSPAYVVGDGLLPSDLDGPTLPPPGSPNYFLGSQDNNGPYGAPSDGLTLWKFTADFVTPANSTFILSTTLPVASFNSILGICAGRACIPQPGTTSRVDHLGYRQRPLFRLGYRNFGTHESLVTNQSVSGGIGPNGEVSGIRWWEVRNPSGVPSVYQEGTYAPGVTDGIHRWMGSMAMNNEGSIALGYSAANNTNPALFPSVRYTGRYADSPLGTLPAGEGSIHEGTGSQTGGGNRWGDYTSLSVDPSDDNTFWHVNQYYPTTSTSGWRLRVGSFKLATVPFSSIVSGGSAIISAGPNNTLDPGETVTVALGIKNLNVGAPGTACTTGALTGTLQSGGGVTAPSGPQNYGSQCTDGPTIYRQFTFTVDPALPCGSTVTASLAVVDGATNFGTINYQFITGSTGPTMITPVENFDGVVAPALPAGWATSFSGSGAPVVTSTTFADTAPNDAFFVDNNTTGLSELTSPTIGIGAGVTRLSFRNLYNTEATWDGMVLEISINGAAFQDIITAGGSFVSGGYTSGLNSSANPLSGRPAWHGLSGGSAAAPAYITSVVTLPSAAAGQNVQFKWRLGADGSVAPGTNPGARIDSISLSVTALVCTGNAPVPSSAVSRKVHGGAGTFDINLPLVPLTGAVGIESRQGTVAGEHQIVLTFAAPVTVGGAAVTSGTGNAAMSVASNIVTINLTGVTDRQRLGLTLSSVNDGANLGSVIVPMGVLAGDVNGASGVTATDISITKSGASTGTVNGSTFRADVVPDGTINTSDIGLVKARSGNTLP